MNALIVAMTHEYVIGRNQTLPFDLKLDKQRFYRLTKGNICIMGRKTYESIPVEYRPLKDRLNLIFTRKSQEDLADWCEAYRNEDGIATNWNLTHDEITKAMTGSKAFAFAKQYQGKDRFFCGGAEIYKQALDLKMIDTLYITWVRQKISDHSPSDQLTHFPVDGNYIRNHFNLIVNKEIIDQDSQGTIRTDFEIWKIK